MLRRIFSHYLPQSEGPSVVDDIADVIFVLQKIMNHPFRPRPSVEVWHFPRIEPSRDFRLGFSFDNELAENSPYNFQFMFRSRLKNDVVRVQMLALAFRKHSLSPPLLVNKLPAQAIPRHRT